MPRKKKPKFNKFIIPDSFLDTLYELTGSLEKNKGYILCYIDEKGNGEIKSRFDSQATEFALMRFLEIYSQNNSNFENFQYGGEFIDGGNEEEEDD